MFSSPPSLKMMLSEINVSNERVTQLIAGRSQAYQECDLTEALHSLVAACRYDKDLQNCTLCEEKCGPESLVKRWDHSQRSMRPLWAMVRGYHNLCGSEEEYG